MEQTYTAALSSVRLIDNILLKTKLSASDVERLTNNATHLQTMVAMDGWTTQDLTILTGAASRATAAVLAFDKTGTFAQIVDAVNTQVITQRDAAETAKATAEAALATATTAHTAAVAAATAPLQAEIARLTALVPVTATGIVTMRQACLALENAALLNDVEALVATLPRPYQIEWQRASMVERTNPLVEVVRLQKAMTVAQIDDLFTLAASL